MVIFLFLARKQSPARLRLFHPNLPDLQSRYQRFIYMKNRHLKTNHQSNQYKMTFFRKYFITYPILFVFVSKVRSNHHIASFLPLQMLSYFCRFLYRIKVLYLNKLSKQTFISMPTPVIPIFNFPFLKL